MEPVVPMPPARMAKGEGSPTAPAPGAAARVPAPPATDGVAAKVGARRSEPAVASLAAVYVGALLEEALAALQEGTPEGERHALSEPGSDTAGGVASESATLHPAACTNVGSEPGHQGEGGPTVAE